MTTSARALAASQLPVHERPLSERFRLLGLEWADAHAAAELLDELKSVSLEQMKTKLIGSQGQMSEAKAERIVKSSPDWEQYIRNMVDHRHKANKLKVTLDAMKIENSEAIDYGANSRAERRF